MHNTGALTHEVLVLPLSPGQYPGQRAIGSNGQVDKVRGQALVDQQTEAHSFGARRVTRRLLAFHALGTRELETRVPARGCSCS